MDGMAAMWKIAGLPPLCGHRSREEADHWEVDLRSVAWRHRWASREELPGPAIMDNKRRRDPWKQHETAVDGYGMMPFRPSHA